jgi:hypothetical protein
MFRYLFFCIQYRYQPHDEKLHDDMKVRSTYFLRQIMREDTSHGAEVDSKSNLPLATPAVAKNHKVGSLGVHATVLLSFRESEDNLTGLKLSI